MGNTLCGHAAHGVAEEPAADNKDVAAAVEQQLQPCSSKQKPPLKGAAERNSTVSLIAAAAGGRRRSSSDEIEAALNSARAELKAGASRSFAAQYSTGRIIGHGAYCKVFACTHNKTGQEFAVKAVGKAASTPKQREGAVHKQSPLSCKQSVAWSIRSMTAAVTVTAAAKHTPCLHLFFPPKHPLFTVLAWCAHLSCRHHQGGCHDAHAGRPPRGSAAAGGF